MNIIENIKKMISELAKIPLEEINPDTQIYGSVVISSLNLLQLIKKCEDHFDLMIEPEDLIEDNFQDLKTLGGFIETRLAAS